MMRRKQVDERQENIFSAPVDVLANTVLVMFLYVVFFLLTIGGEDPALPRLFDIQFPSCISGLPYEYSIPSSGGVGPRKLSITKGRLPKNLTLDQETGTIAGIVPISLADTNYQFTVKLEDPYGQDEKNYSIQVTKSVLPISEEDYQLSFTNEDKKLKDGRVGHKYEGIIGHTGGGGLIEWRETSPGVLSAFGLKLRNGRIFGTPTKYGNFNFTIEASFPQGYTRFRNKGFAWETTAIKKQFNLRILPQLKDRAKWPFVRVNQDIRLVTVGALLSDETVTFENIPKGLIGSSDGVLAGVMTKAGIYNIKYKVQKKEDDILLENSAMLEVLPSLPEPETEDIFVSARLGETVSIIVPYIGLTEPVKIENRKEYPSSIKIINQRVDFTPKLEGFFNIELYITGALGKSIKTNFTFLGLPPQRELNIELPDVLNFILNKKLHYPIATIGGVGTHTISIEGKVPGITFKKHTIEGTPKEVGEWPITIIATDKITNEVAKHKLSLRIKTDNIEPFKILTHTLPAALIEKEYEVALSTRGAIGEVKWSISGNLPDGLKLMNGKIIGIPKLKQHLKIKLLAMDSMNRTDTVENLNISTFYIEESKPLILTDSLPIAIVGQPFDVSLAAEGGLGNYSWEVNGELPPKFSFKNGRIQGIPTMDMIGEWKMNIVVTDERNIKSAPVQLSIFIKELVPFDPFSIRITKLPNAIVNENYDTNMAFEQDRSTIKWILNGELPKGLDFLDGRITGIPILSEECNFYIIADDSKTKQKLKRNYRLNVIDSMPSLKFADKNIVTLYMENKLTFSVILAGGFIIGLIISFIGIRLINKKRRKI